MFSLKRLVVFFSVCFITILFIFCSSKVSELANADYANMSKNKSNIYVHRDSPSLLSKIIQMGFGLFSDGSKIEKSIAKNKFNNTSFQIPNRFATKFDVSNQIFEGKKIHIISPKNRKNNDRLVLYTHGGAYVHNIVSFQWKFVEQMIEKTGCTFVVPDYPLAPQSNALKTIGFMKLLYQKTAKDFTGQKIILLGDSAGAGLALALSLDIKNQDSFIKPHKIILLSPWVDVTQTNQEILGIEKRDKMLMVNDLHLAGKLYAGELDTKDYRVSPIYGDFSNLPPISIFAGTNDILFPDAKKLKDLLNKNEVTTHYYEYPSMFHDWMFAPFIKEAKHANQLISNTIISN